MASLFTGLKPRDFFYGSNYEAPVNTVEELTVRVSNVAESIRRNSDMLAQKM
jgi:hypothetical protein